MIRDYDDFWVEILPAGDGAHWVTVRCTEGEDQVKVKLAIQAMSPQAYAVGDAITRKRTRGQVDIVQSSAKEVERFGKMLFARLLPERLNDLYVSSRAIAAKQQRGTRFKLRIKDPMMARLPWELLYSRRDQFLALSEQTPIVRHPAVPKPISPLETKLPLRVLAVLSNSRENPLNLDEERRRVDHALSRLRDHLEVVWLEPQTPDALREKIDEFEPHVIHFAGHGAFNEETKEGYIVLEEKGEAIPFAGLDLALLLKDAGSVRLVFLNSCEGAREGPNAFSSTASHIIETGIPAVIAMQFEISDDIAVRFAEVVYRRLANNRPIEAAVAEARLAIREPNSFEWCTPVLYMRSQEGTLFRFDDSKSAPIVNSVPLVRDLVSKSTPPRPVPPIPPAVPERPEAVTTEKREDLREPRPVQQGPVIGLDAPQLERQVDSSAFDGEPNASNNAQDIPSFPSTPVQVKIGKEHGGRNVHLLVMGILGTMALVLFVASRQSGRPEEPTYAAPSAAPVVLQASAEGSRSVPLGRAGGAPAELTSLQSASDTPAAAPMDVLAEPCQQRAALSPKLADVRKQLCRSTMKPCSALEQLALFNGDAQVPQKELSKEIEKIERILPVVVVSSSAGLPFEATSEHMACEAKDCRDIKTNNSVAQRTCPGKVTVRVVPTGTQALSLQAYSRVLTLKLGAPPEKVIATFQTWRSATITLVAGNREPEHITLDRRRIMAVAIAAYVESGHHTIEVTWPGGSKTSVERTVKDGDAVQVKLPNVDCHTMNGVEMCDPQ